MEGVDTRVLVFVGIFIVVFALIFISVVSHGYRRRKELAALAPCTVWR